MWLAACGAALAHGTQPTYLPLPHSGEALTGVPVTAQTFATWVQLAALMASERNVMTVPSAECIRHMDGGCLDAWVPTFG
jgi:hypothetical protein